MSTTMSQYGTVGVLSLADELTGENVEIFAEQAKKFVEGGGCDAVVDCSKVEAIDSAGLEALLDFQSACEANLGCVKLCALNALCAKILEITRLARRFEAFAELDSAVRSFS